MSQVFWVLRDVHEAKETKFAFSFSPLALSSSTVVLVKKDHVYAFFKITEILRKERA
jgi:hypothetical protein